MMDVLQFVVGNGFWQFVGCMILLAICINGTASIIRAFMKVPEYPQKCPRCGFDHDAMVEDGDEDEMMVKLSGDVDEDSEAEKRRRRRGYMYDGGWRMRKDKER